MDEQAVTTTGYPATVGIDYPDRELNRLTTFFRPFTVIPIAIVLALVSGPTMHAGSEYAFESGGIVFAATVLMLVFRQKYPRWWFDWNVALVRFGTRVSTYLALLRDEYPSTDDEQAVHIVIPYPDARYELNRWLPLFKWLLAVPHYVVLGLLAVAAVFCVLFAWFAILFTGRYPRPLFDFVVGMIDSGGRRAESALGVRFVGRFVLFHHLADSRTEEVVQTTNARWPAPAQA